MIETIRILRLFVMVFLPVSMIAVGRNRVFVEKMRSTGIIVKSKANNKIKQTRLKWLNQEKIMEFLIRTGAEYLFHGKLEPITFLLAQAASGLLLLTAGIRLLGITGCIFFVIGFMLPRFLLQISNDADNHAMLYDIKNMYDTLRIQTRAGVFFTTALSECYRAVKSGRLKAALLELSGQIAVKQDLETAIDEFNRKFQNVQIDSFCIVLKQSLTSGKTIQVLEDISRQLEDIQHKANLLEKDKLERKVQVMELLLFLGMLAISIFCIWSEMTVSLIQF